VGGVIEAVEVPVVRGSENEFPHAPQSDALCYEVESGSGRRGLILCVTTGQPPKL